MSEPRIPTEVGHDEWLIAMEPLFALLNVSPGEVVGDVNIVSMAEPVYYEIRFNVVAREEGDDSDIPAGIPMDGDDPQGDEFAVWEHRINVAVV